MKCCLHFRTYKLIVLIFLISILSALNSNGQASCATPGNLTPGLACVTTTGDLQDAVNETPAGACTGGTTNGVWYMFTATSPSAIITVAGLGSNLATNTTYVEVLSGSCGSLTSLACQNVATSLNITTLTTGVDYYVRVYVTAATTSNPGNRRGFTICLVSSPNDGCNAAISLSPNTTCINTAGSILLSTPIGSIPAGCQPVGTHYDVWYSFVAANASSTVTLSSLGSGFSNPALQLFSGICGGLTSVACGTTTLTVLTLTIGNTYYIRVSNIGSVPLTNGGFNICVTQPPSPPSNNNCSGAITINATTSCTNTSGTLNIATASTGNPVGCEGPGTHYDVWYRFTAARAYEIINLTGLGSNFTNPTVQLYLGTCVSMSSVACSTTFPFITYGLTIGATYYIRVSNVGTAITTNGGFNLCVYHPTASNYDYSKSYVNISKNSGGGTINPGDTLEIRATLAIRSLSLDSLAFFDTLRNGSGLRLIPGSITLRTNEGKIYKGFTDAIDGDAGHRYTNGLDTVIRMNMGVGATNTNRGKLRNNSKPSVFGGTCIIMATYRVVVYGNYGSTLNLGGGAFTIRDSTLGFLNTFNLSNRSALIYSSPGLCPNAVSATNAIGGDFNGTFGVPAGSAPLARNRGTSINVPSYIYKTFQPGQGPNDYYYGIANNTSATFTTSNTWPKNDTRRVFNVWDITGDHTGATDPVKGNPPCDTTQVVSPTNPCGYMLVINSAYKTDTAFRFAVTNLCPNTYYEISAWIKNICSKCSCDSNGVGTSGAGYIPFAPGDSSGVQPNLAFDINGIDYFTTGNIVHTGNTANRQTGSDSTNIWVKRGFTYLTGTSQTSLTLTLRNNAPGGGGNDWALDDISFATCLPNMRYSPTLNPMVCDSNTITIRDTVRSYFNNYNNYKWQRSTDAGSTWSDIAGTTGTGTPVLIGSEYEYVASYTVPPTQTYAANNGDKYRLIVATTPSNLTSTDCQVTDGISIVTLQVLDCMGVLSSNLLSFNGQLIGEEAHISWTMSKEDEPLTFDIEKSHDGINFSLAGTVHSKNNYQSEINYYSLIDPQSVSGKTWYRLVIKNSKSNTKVSKTILLQTATEDVEVVKVVNPFNNELVFYIVGNKNSNISAEIIDMFGKTLSKTNYMISTGLNKMSINNTNNLARGIYTLRIISKENIVSRQVIKIN